MKILFLKGKNSVIIKDKWRVCFKRVKNEVV